MTLSRLQLAVGPAASIIQELAAEGGLRFFSARAPHESSDAPPSRLVVLHPAPPFGPSAGALLERMASIRATAHPGVAAPLATGDFEGSGWIVEPVVPRVTVASRLGDRGGLSVNETIGVLRESARALVALHRHGVSHGAISSEALSIYPDRGTLHRLGRVADFDPQADWQRLGEVLQRAVAGNERRQPTFPAELTGLIDRMAAASGKSIGGEEVLGVLDRFPSSDSRDAAAEPFVGNARRGVRDPTERHLLLVVVVAAVLLLAWLLVRGR